MPLSYAYIYQGTARILENELSGTRYHGKKLTLTGAGATNVMIHSVSWDVGSGETSIGFGPVPELAPADFLELQRRLANRKVTWWSGLERADNRHGALNAPSAAGDTVGGYHGPQTIMDAPSNLGPPFMPVKIAKTVAGFDVTLQPGHVRDMITADGEAVEYWVPKVGNKFMDDDEPPKIAMKTEDFVYVKYLTDKEGLIKEDPTLEVAADVPASVHYQPIDGDAEGSGGVDGEYYVKIGQLVAVGVDGASWVPFVASDIVHWHELWTGENLGEDAAYVYKDRDPETNVYRFRGIKGRFGIVEEEEDEKISLDFDAENIGDGAAILKLPEVEGEDPLPDATAQFRTIRAMNSTELEQEGISAQMQVVEAESEGQEVEPKVKDTILVRGNAKKGKLKFVKPPVGTADPELIKEFKWEDGFVNEDEDIEVEILSGGAALDLRITHWGEDTATGVISPSDSDTFLYWRKGLFVGDVDPGDAPAGLIEKTVSEIHPGS